MRHEERIKKIGEELRASREELLAAVGGIGEEEAVRRPPGGGWSVKEVLAHLPAAERQWGGSAVRLLRGEEVNLPSEEEILALRDRQMPGWTSRPLEEILADMELWRSRTMELLGRIGPLDLELTGTLGGQPFTLEQALLAIALHEREHARQVMEIRASLAGGGVP